MDHIESSAQLLGQFLQPAPELTGNVILPQLHAGISHGRTRMLHEWLCSKPAEGLSQPRRRAC
jgi:hypothetical protein